MLETCADDSRKVEFSVSDQSQLGSLLNWLRGQHSDVQIVRTPSPPDPNEQGGLDFLTVIGSSSVLVAAIKTLPDFIRSRRSGFKIETTINGEKFIISGANMKNFSSILERVSGV
jgi:hypothetical protein